MQPQDRLNWRPDVVQAPLTEGETALLNLASKQYYTLNETGTFIWTRLGKRLSLEEISSELEAAYEVSHEDALNCVMELADELQRVELVVAAQG